METHAWLLEGNLAIKIKSLKNVHTFRSRNLLEMYSKEIIPDAWAICHGVPRTCTAVLIIMVKS